MVKHKQKLVKCFNRHKKRVTWWLTRAWVWASLVQAFVTQWAFKKGKRPGSVWEESKERKERHWNEINRTKGSKAFAENQRISECFVEAGLQALIRQLWSIHWTLCWPSVPQVNNMWMGEEQVNSKCNWSEIQVTLECPRWNASARRVSRECQPRAGCRPKKHFHRKNFTVQL